MIKYIFSISTGRSGSHYLYTLFDKMDDCQAEHEPHPRMNDKLMRDYLDGRPQGMKEAMPDKIKDIETRKGDKKLYIETSHIFIKGFGWYIPEYIPQEEIGIVILNREAEAVAKSYYKMFCTPITRGGRQWVMLPLVDKNLAPFPERHVRLKYHLYRFLNRTLLHRRMMRILTFWKHTKATFIKNYELRMLEWYVRETTARAEQYKQTFPDITYFDTTVQTLNTEEGFQQLLDHFGIEIPMNDQVKAAISKRTNLRESTVKV